MDDLFLINSGNSRSRRRRLAFSILATLTDSLKLLERKNPEKMVRLKDQALKLVESRFPKWRNSKWINVFVNWLVYWTEKDGWEHVSNLLIEQEARYLEYVGLDSIKGQLNSGIFGPEQLGRKVEVWAASEEEKNRPKESKILTFPNGWYWVSLNTGYCPLEAKRMKHCGGEGGKGENLLSLRDPKGAPHLTFSVSGNTLTEGRGRANTEPKPIYHPYIRALLKTKNPQNGRLWIEDFSTSAYGGDYSYRFNPDTLT